MGVKEAHKPIPTLSTLAPLPNTSAVWIRCGRNAFIYESAIHWMASATSQSTHIDTGSTVSPSVTIVRLKSTRLLALQFGHLSNSVLHQTRTLLPYVMLRLATTLTSAGEDLVLKTHPCSVC
ncbi:hypothetical protein BC830DRAFT_1145581 [Chytriomyces sp. MP71]|nr:hypothetical protein BC830DRAFT_1145581 [Chytriomyces sp. MP71]